MVCAQVLAYLQLQHLHSREILCGGDSSISMNGVGSYCYI